MNSMCKFGGNSSPSMFQGGVYQRKARPTQCELDREALAFGEAALGKLESSDDTFLVIRPSASGNSL